MWVTGAPGVDRGTDRLNSGQVRYRKFLICAADDKRRDRRHPTGSHRTHFFRKVGKDQFRIGKFTTDNLSDK